MTDGVSTNDWHLLRRFTEHNSQEAFAALTARYLTLVYSVCRREMDNAEAAEDVTQAVFLILARKAPTLGRNVVLSGWLFQTARFAAKNAQLQAQRRAAYEQKAAEAMQQQSEGREDAAWSEIEPLLNRSLAALRGSERDCILLRFFQGLSFSEAGAALGLSEEAARKRVTRALEKMRKFLEKGGVIVPGAALAALLSAHAVKAAPAPVVAAVARITPGTIPGPISQITEGVLHAMKIAKMKALAGAVALALAGTAATYGVVRGVAAPTGTPGVSTTAPAPPAQLTSVETLKKMMADAAAPTKYRTVALTGRVRLLNGKGAGGVHVLAQLQDSYMAKLDRSNSDPLSEPMNEQYESFAHTRPDGTYTLYIGADMDYNLLVVRDDVIKDDDHDTKLVATAAEGVSGRKGATVRVPDLLLTPGGFVIGTVTNGSGKPLPDIHVGSYGPHRPASSAAIISTRTDSLGRYRLRVAPGQSRVYVADGRYGGGSGVEQEATVTVAAGETKAANFRVTLSKPEVKR